MGFFLNKQKKKILSFSLKIFFTIFFLLHERAMPCRPGGSPYRWLAVLPLAVAARETR